MGTSTKRFESGGLVWRKLSNIAKYCWIREYGKQKPIYLLPLFLFEHRIALHYCIRWPQFDVNYLTSLSRYNHNICLSHMITTYGLYTNRLLLVFLLFRNCYRSDFLLMKYLVSYLFVIWRKKCCWSLNIFFIAFYESVQCWDVILEDWIDT